MRKDKFKDNEKRLCQQQEKLCKTHVANCAVCRQSMKEFEDYGISNTPPCKQYRQQLKEHIQSCHTCNQGMSNFKEDMIPISQEMREIVGELKKGNIFNIDPVKLKKVSQQIFGKLNMSSDEIRKAQEKSNKAVRDGLDNA